jgi:flagellar hook-associated protein 2
MTMLRISGIASGIDTNQFVADLMRVERMKADRLQQQRQVVSWQKDQFRALIAKTRRFQDTFFNTANPTSNMMSQSSLKKMTVSSSQPETVTATANTDAFTGSISVQIISSALPASAKGTQVSQSVDQPVLITDTLTVAAEKLAGEFSMDDGMLRFRINTQNFVFHETDTLDHVFKTINSSNAGVQVQFSSFSDSLMLTAKETGNKQIETDNGSHFFSAFKMPLTLQDPDTYSLGTPGRDAHFTINGIAGSRSANAFTIDGISYQINSRVDEASSVINLTVKTDVEQVYQTIAQFVEDYNALLDSINDRLTQERFRDFHPLTNEQKEKMSEGDMEKWEEKAQSGLLRSDPALESILRALREAVYSKVGEDHLSQIGIETSRNYRDRGKLILINNGASLREAIEATPDRVATLFSKRSDIRYSPDLSTEDREKRYEESGLAHRMSDVLNRYIRITRDSAGRKGLLLERAGVEGDISEFRNSFDRQITEIDRRMERLQHILDRKEEQYYRQFAAMEKALQQLYSQGDWLTMQMNSNF